MPTPTVSWEESIEIALGEIGAVVRDWVSAIKSGESGYVQAHKNIRTILVSLLSQAETAARLAERERIVGIAEGIPIKNPERESDEYDNGRRSFKANLISRIEEI